MSDEKPCPQCGAALAANAPHGLCPNCLARMAVGEAEAPTIAAPISEQPGDRIGRYILREKIGEGGCGIVYVAEQEEPVRRKVALKIIKLGMDTKEVIARFEAERQALALMDHPNIARVYDGGATGESQISNLKSQISDLNSQLSTLNSQLPSGRPYFVMELVRGTRITEFCDQNQLPTLERLKLFIQVCHAIQHAHQKGIIHRDIKPSNILVMMADDVPVPKVIDFGIAKAIGERLTDKTLYTRYDQFIGTPAYMSPEQAGMSGLDVDTRSDIYALGVLLYELLTGKTPFDTAELRKVGLDEMLRTIREKEPLRPSTRLLRERTAARADLKSQISNLKFEIHADLDWIVMKCLEKNRARRYDSAAELARDLERHRRHEPVLAGPPSRLYRLGKFARRYRLPLTAASCVVTTLVLATLFSYRQATQARSKAAEALRMGELAKAHEGEAKAARAEAEGILRRTDLDAVRRRLAGDQAAEALALLARMLRQDPQDRAVSRWLLNTLTRRSFSLPSLEPLGHPAKVHQVEFNPAGTIILTASGDNCVRLWDAASGRLLLPPLSHPLETARRDTFRFSIHPIHAAFSPDGRRVATGSADFTARLWDVQTGQPISPPLPHSNWVTAVSFSPDSELLATACKDGTVRLWKADRGEAWGPVLRHAAWANSVQFSPDGSRLVTASDDRTARIWELPSGQPAAPPLTHEHGVRVAAFSPDGKRMVTASADHTARLWNAATGEPLGAALNHQNTVVAAAFSPDGTIVATASLDNTVGLWSGFDGRPLMPLLRHDDEVRSIHFSPEGLRLLTGSADKTARIWDVQTGRVLAEPLAHHGPVWCARFSPDGRQVITASGDGTGQVWDVRPGQALGHFFPASSRTVFVRWSPDGGRLLVVDAEKAAVWDVASGDTADYPGLSRQGGVLCAQFSPDGQRLVTGTSYGTAQVWSGWGERALTPPLQHAGAIRWVEFSPDGRTVVSASAGGSARLWDSTTGQPLGSPCQHRAALSVARFSPDGRSLLTASADRTARLWDAATGQATSPALVHRDRVTYAEFSRDGRWFVTASADYTGRVWETSSGQAVGQVLRHRAPIESARFNPAGNLVVTASEDGTARLWDWRTGQPIGQPLTHRARVHWAEFSPDGRQVLTASEDGTVGLWDAPTGFPICPPLKHAENVDHAEFSPDGSAIATAGFDRVARIWPLATAEGRGPDWLPELAEAVAGQRLDTHRAVEDVPAARFLQLKSQLAEMPGQDAYSAWGRWFVADRSTRAVSPGAKRSVRQFEEDLLAPWDLLRDPRLIRLHEALKLNPTNGVAYGRYAYALNRARNTNQAGLEAKATWLCRRTAQVAAGTADTCLACALQHYVNRDTNAMRQSLAAAVSLSPSDPLLWLFHGWFAARCDGWAVAYRSIITADELARQAWPERHRNRLHFERTTAFRWDPTFQSKHAAEFVQECRARFWSIPPRDPTTPARCLDLTTFYQVSLDYAWLLYRLGPLDLKALPCGRSRLGGIEFDARGVVQLSSRSLEALGWPWPKEVRGIPVRQTCRRLHFVHATDVAVEPGTVVGRYRVRFADGQEQEIPLAYGRDLETWFEEKAAGAQLLTPAWQLRAPGTHRFQLYRTTWENPRPSVALESLDLFSTMTEAAPFLVAVTADPKPAEP